MEIPKNNDVTRIEKQNWIKIIFKKKLLTSAKRINEPANFLSKSHAEKRLKHNYETLKPTYYTRVSFNELLVYSVGSSERLIRVNFES